MNRIKIFFIPLFLLSLLFPIFFAQSSGETEPDWHRKVDGLLLAQLNQRSADNRPLEMIIMLDEQAELDVPADLPKEERGRLVYERLVATANASQPNLIQQLDEMGSSYERFFIVNAIYAQAPASEVAAIAQRADVAFLYANPATEIGLAAADTSPSVLARGPQAAEWGIAKIGAPELWARGIMGNGAVIAGQDTGYYWNHIALINSYRGWDGNTADHNYNWHDAISSDLNGNNSNPCGYEIAVPCDDVSSNHGTHTMGTMVGLDGADQIGVAPDARWMACRNMEEGFGTPATYINCFEWFLAPTNLADESPNPAMAPHVINNSWGCPTSEGCNTGNFGMMNTVIENLRTAGIVVVTSAGNSGAGCSTVNTPAAIFEGSFSVGATDFNDGIAGFSSRGPVSVDGSGRVKPNVTAPGVGVRSAAGTDSYRFLQGTSMAGPHVAGAVGLLIDAYPPIAGNVEAIETYLEESADFVGIGNCGGDANFNNTFGHGRINVVKAVDAIWNLDLLKTVPPPSASDTLTYTLTLTKTGPMLTFTNVAISDTVPAGTTFVSASEPVSVTGGSLVWQIGEMAPHEVRQLTIIVNRDGGTQPLFGAATVSADFVPDQQSNHQLGREIWLPLVVK